MNCAEICECMASFVKCCQLKLYKVGRQVAGEYNYCSEVSEEFISLNTLMNRNLFEHSRTSGSMFLVVRKWMEKWWRMNTDNTYMTKA